MENNTFPASEGDINNTPDRARWVNNLQHPQTAEVLRRDASVFLHQALSTPCLDVLAGSNGIGLQTLRGTDYIDFHGNNVHQLGHKNTYIINRVKEQMDSLVFSPRRFTNLPAIQLAEALSALSGGKLSRSLFTPGGTSAISMALKLARAATKKFKTISMYDSFHGASLDSISIGGEYSFQQDMGPLLTGSIHVPPVDSYRGIWADSPRGDLAYADYIEYVIEKEGDVGAIIAETVRSTSVHIPSKAYWKKIRQVCNKHHVLLILDEVPIAMGRTGTMFAFEQFDIVPDILVLGKGLGAGVIPMAALLCKEELNIASHISLGHFTHEKNPLGATAALAAFEYMDQHQVLGHVKKMESYVRGRLDKMKERFEVVGDVRGTGLLWGIELVSDKQTRAENPALAEKVLYQCLKNGLSIKVSGANVLCLYPPLVITEQELADALQIIEDALEYSLSDCY